MNILREYANIHVAIPYTIKVVDVMPENWLIHRADQAINRDDIKSGLKIPVYDVVNKKFKNEIWIVFYITLSKKENKYGMFASCEVISTLNLTYAGYCKIIDNYWFPLSENSLIEATKDIMNQLGLEIHYNK